MHHLALLQFLSISTGFAAEPVLLPDFVPPGPEDWVVTTMVQGLVADRLVTDGMIVLSSEVAGRAVPPESLVGCGPSPTCPQDVLPALPARAAAVVTLNRAGTTMVGHVELYAVGQPTPMSTIDLPIVPGNEHLFAVEVSRATQGLLNTIGASPDAVLLSAARLIAGQAPTLPVPVPAPVAPAPVAPAPVPVTPQPLVDLETPTPVPRVAVKKGDGSTPHTGPLGPILEDTGVHERHLLGSEQNFRKSGLDPRDWMFQATPHAGRLTVQVGAALGMGDVDRSAVTMALIEDGQQTNGYYQEGPDSARRVRGDVFVGYAPLTMLDVGLAAGLQYSGADLTYLVFEREPDGTDDLIQRPPKDDIQAVQFYLQPRVRGYLVPVGPAKPYLFTGMEFKFVDRYRLARAEIAYPLPSTLATIPGWIGGGGMVIDPSPIFGVYVEGSYTRHFGPRAGRTVGYDLADWTPTYTPIPETLGITVAVGGGIQFRL